MKTVWKSVLVVLIATATFVSAQEPAADDPTDGCETSCATPDGAVSVASPLTPPHDPPLIGASPIDFAEGGSGAGVAATVGAVALGLGLVAILLSATAVDDLTENCPSFTDCCPGAGGSGGCGIPTICSCPAGTTDQGVCTGAGCGASIVIGDRSCTCD